jgi:hypothetical protein
MCATYAGVSGLSDIYVGEKPTGVKHWNTGELHPYMRFLGSVRRFVPYKVQALVDPIVSDWIRHDGIDFHREYSMCSPNPAAMLKSIAKYNRAQPEPEAKVWEHALHWTERHFGAFVGGSEEIPLESVIRLADRQTSAGYPFSLKYKSKGDFLDSEDALPIFDIMWSRLATDDPLVPFWTASLKYELRHAEKLATNSIRTFTASSTEMSTATNRLCLDFNERFYRSNNLHWSFVGGSMFRGGWNALFKRLSKHPNAFELDESSFDASLFRSAMFGQRDLRLKLMRDDHRTPDNCKRMHNLYNFIVDSVIVLDSGECVQKCTGNPSGSANTIVDNTMILFRLFAYAWLVLARERDRDLAAPLYCNYPMFMRHVEAALNGDDNTFTCSDEVVSWFNAKTVSKVWSSIGVKTTTPCEASRKLIDVSFLSHAFINLDGFVMPLPERTKVLCSLLYASEYVDPRWTLLRLSALRMTSWADVKLRAELVRCRQFLYAHHARELVGSFEGIPAEDIKAMWKTDAEIHRLYTMPKLEVGATDLFLRCVQLIDEAVTRKVSYRFKKLCIAKAMPAKKKEEKKSVPKGKAAVRVHKISKEQFMKLQKHGGSAGKDGVPVGMPAAVGANVVKKTMPPTIVENRELIGNVMAGAEVASTHYLISVANKDLHRWLAKVALNFQSGEYEYCRLVYLPTVSTDVSSAVVLSLNANPDAEPDETIEEAANRDGADMCSAFLAGKCELKTKATGVLGPKRYVQDLTSGDFAGILDSLATVATGVAQVLTGATELFSAVAASRGAAALKRVTMKPATVRAATAAAAPPAAVDIAKVSDPPAEPIVIGQLYVEYKVKFLSPQLSDDDLDGISSVEASDTTLLDGLVPFGTKFIPWRAGEELNPMGMVAQTHTVSNSHGTAFFFKHPGVYMCSGWAGVVAGPNTHTHPVTNLHVTAEGGGGSAILSNVIGARVTDAGAEAPGEIEYYTFFTVFEIVNQDTDYLWVRYDAGNALQFTNAAGGRLDFLNVAPPAASVYRAWAAVARARGCVPAVSNSEMSKGFFEMRRNAKMTREAEVLKSSRAALARAVGNDPSQFNPDGPIVGDPFAMGQRLTLKQFAERKYAVKQAVKAVPGFDEKNREAMGAVSTDPSYVMVRPAAAAATTSNRVVSRPLLLQAAGAGAGAASGRAQK